MGLYDRDYTQAEYRSEFRGTPPMWKALFWITPVVKRLLIINLVIFAVCAVIPAVRGVLYAWFSVYWSVLGTVFQPWRLVTYQFLHEVERGGHIVFGHIFGNMVGLFFFGRMLERHWGSKKFLAFYLICGAVGGLLYPVLVAAGFLHEGILIGASGAVFGVLAAITILFPRVMVYIWGIFPIPLVVLTIVYLLYIITGLLGGKNAGGEAVHLAGMAAGAVYVLSQGWRAKLKLRMQSGTRQKKEPTQHDLQLEVDRILQKIHDSGIHSLTPKEKRTLKQATEAEQMRNKFYLM